VNEHRFSGSDTNSISKLHWLRGKSQLIAAIGSQATLNRFAWRVIILNTAIPTNNIALHLMRMVRMRIAQHVNSQHSDI
jgi:hypothetical protein